MTDWALRPFDTPDTDAVVLLWQRCGLTRPWNDPRRDIERKRTVQPQLFIVAEAQTQVIGSVMAGYDGHRGWINYLAVDPAWQGQGLGRALMQQAQDALLALGCPKINLQVRAGNTQALAFYQRLGFVQDEVLSLGKRLVEDGVPPSPTRPPG